MLCDHKKRTIHQISLVFIIQTRTHEQRIHSKIIICISTLSEDETFYIIVSENVYCTQIPYNVTDVAMTIMCSFYLFIFGYAYDTLKGMPASLCTWKLCNFFTQFLLPN